MCSRGLHSSEVVQPKPAHGTVESLSVSSALRAFLGLDVVHFESTGFCKCAIGITALPTSQSQDSIGVALRAIPRR